MRKIITLTGVIAVVGILAAAACGGGEETPATRTATPAARATGSPAAATPQPTMPAGKTYPSAPAMTIDPSKSYFATIKTAKGDIRIQLFPDIAPQTVNSFVFLARDGYFDGVTFHRVIADGVAQTGDPTGSGRGSPGYIIPDEFSDRPYDTGVVGMANTGRPNSNGSQFFITYSRQASFDGKYTVFGQVVEGMEVAKALTPRDPQTNPNAPPGDAITTITIEEQ
jgi:peptidylprolyl isomerase